VKKENTKVQVKKWKMQTVFSQTQLCVLNDRFWKQKYISHQQMQELSGILNLPYKQVKTWFQNQRMKSKRWQKSKWPKNGNSVTQKGLVLVDSPGFHLNCHEEYVGNTSSDLPVWSNQT
jgi:homeobox protein Nanog